MGKTGVGLKVESTRAGFVVCEIVDKSPAEQCRKIHIGDLLVSIDGIDIQGSTAALAPLMIGLPGTEVVLGLLKEPGGAVHYVRLQRRGPKKVAPTRLPRREKQLEEKRLEEEHTYELEHGVPPKVRSTDEGSSRSVSASPPHSPALSNKSEKLSRSPVRKSASTSGSSNMKDFHHQRPHTSEGIARRRDSFNDITMEAVNTPLANFSYWDDSEVHDGAGAQRPSRRRPLALLPGTHRDPFAPSPAPTQPYLLSEPPMPHLKHHRKKSTPNVSAITPTAAVLRNKPTTSPAAPPTTAATQRLKSGYMLVGSTPIAENFFKYSNDAEAMQMGERDEEEDKTLAMLMRTPEGKMWKAEMRRERARHEEDLRRKWALDPLTGECGGGRFNMSEAKSQLDWVIYYAKQLPAPVDYNPQKKGRNMGGKFSSSVRNIDPVDPGQRYIPGVGSYSPDFKVLKPNRGVKMANAERHFATDDLIRNARELPGPGEYGTGKSEWLKSYSTLYKQQWQLDEQEKYPAKLVRAAHDIRPGEARHVPGPGLYDTFGARANGGKEVIKGGTMGGANVPSNLDIIERVAAQLPGPTDYNAMRDVKQSGGRFSTSVVPSNTDILCRTAAQIPGPGNYRVRVKKRTGFAKSTDMFDETDKLMRAKSKIPGPGAYGAPGKGIGQDVHGGKMSNANPASDVEVRMREAAKLPAPGDYGVPSKPGLPHHGSTRFGPVPARRSKSVMDVTPGPADYISNMPKERELPRGGKGWKQYENYYPFMRFRAR